MKKQQLLYGIISLLVIMSMIGFASAANTITLLSPAQDQFTSGSTFLLNTSLDTNSANVTNVTFYYKTDGGAWTLIGRVINTSAQQLAFNRTFASTALTDRNNMTFNATGANITGAIITEDTSTGVQINNGVPTVTFSSASIGSSGQVRISDSFTLGIDADATIGINNCTVAMNSVTIALTATANACTSPFLASNFSIIQPSASEFTATFTATDDNNNATSNTRLFKIIEDLPTGQTSLGGGGATTTTTEDTTTGMDVDQPPAPNFDAPVKKGFFTKIGDVFRNIIDAITFWN